jgi:hypothetical protein
MKLEAYPIGDGGGMGQVQTELASLKIQLVEPTKRKEKREQVSCVTCRTEGYHLDECLAFAQYLESGALNTLPREGYYEICKKWGHHPPNCPLLRKYRIMPQNLFCNLCKSVGHEEKDFHAFNLMRESTSYMYRI